MAETPADVRPLECQKPAASASFASAVLIRLVLLLLANMVVVAGALLIRNHLLASLRDFNPASGIIMACGVLESGALAAGVCGGFIIAFAARSNWIGLALAVLYGTGLGCIDLGARFFSASPTQIAQYQQEWVAVAAHICLRAVVTYAVASLVGLWWRATLRLTGDFLPLIRRQFSLAELLHAITAAAVSFGVFTLIPSRKSRILEIMDVVSVVLGAVPSVAPVLWVLLQPRLRNWHWAWVLPVLIAFPIVKYLILYYVFTKRGIPGDPWFHVKSVFVITIGYLLVATFNALILRGVGFRWSTVG